MQDVIARKGRLPACVLSGPLLEELWRVLGQEGEYSWQAKVGTGGDLLGKQMDRPQEVIVDHDQLVALLASLPRIDSLRITAEFAEKGAVSLTFHNYSRPGGVIVVSGSDRAWVGAKYQDLRTLLEAVKENVATKLYHWLGFAIIHSVLPLALSFIVVVLAAALAIPAWARQSELIWWISVGTMIATLWVAAKVSDRLISHFLQKYPYIRWLS